MKIYECIRVNHHRDIAPKIVEWQTNGWQFHTYSCAQLRPSEINHYRLFERDAMDSSSVEDSTT